MRTNKLRQTKETKELFNEYILKCISTDGHSLKEEPLTNKERLQFLYNTFKAEYGFLIKERGKYTAFKEWLQGLPSSFNIEFMNAEIIKLAESIYQCELTEKEQYKVLSNWFNFISVKTFKLFEKYNIKEVTE
jgi:hypothetical protein